MSRWASWLSRQIFTLEMRRFDPGTRYMDTHKRQRIQFAGVAKPGMAFDF